MKEIVYHLNKKNYNICIAWIFIYLVFMIMAGLFTYSMMFDNLYKQNVLTTNMFKTILDQNAQQLITNPDKFQRVVVSDVEGEVLIQYGSLIPGLTTLHDSLMFSKVKQGKMAMSNFYFDPILKQVAFDIGINYKNRIYIGTITLDESIGTFIGNVELSEFIVLDENRYGYYYKEDNFAGINKNSKEIIEWVSSVLFKQDSLYYFYIGRNIGNLEFYSFTPVLDNLLPLFLLFVIPFFIGLILILFQRKMMIKNLKEQAVMVDKISEDIHEGKFITENVFDKRFDINKNLYHKINDLLEKNKNCRMEILRYSEKLGDYSENLKELKLNLEYIKRFFEELQLKKAFDLEESIIELFRMFFDNNKALETIMLKLNNNEIFSSGEIVNIDFEEITDLVEIGTYKVELMATFKNKKHYDLKQIELLHFGLFVRYLLYIHITKTDEYTNEFNSTKNFQLFSDLVSKEIHKANRYNLKGLLAYFLLENCDEIKEKYGESILSIINDSMSAILRNEIRKSDILGTYKEGFFLVYFYDFDLETVKEKNDKIVYKIKIEEKIKQLGIEIKIKTGFVPVEKNTKDFETIFGKCLIEK
jgi:GGDEF domain-containing protein